MELLPDCAIMPWTVPALHVDTVVLICTISRYRSVSTRQPCANLATANCNKQIVVETLAVNLVS